MMSSLPLPEGLPLDAASWEQTPLVVRQVVGHLLAVTQQQTAQIQTFGAWIGALEACLHQRSSYADRPASSDPPYEKRPPCSGGQGQPVARPGPSRHHQALWAPTEILEVMPAACSCRPQGVAATTPEDTHQVIERPEIQRVVTPVVLHKTRCPRCGRLLKAELPAEYRCGYGPRLTALVAFEALVEHWSGILISAGYRVYRQWMHQRQTCLAHLIRRARGLSEQKGPELARFGYRVMAELQRLVHWATAPPTSGEVQTWYARTVCLVAQHRQRKCSGGRNRQIQETSGG